MGIIQTLIAAGFICSAVHNGAGNLCTVSSVKTAHFTYSNPIAIYVPQNAPGHASQIVLHLQGFRGICDSPDDSAETLMETYDLIGQFISDAGVSSVLVFPVSSGNDTTYEQKFLGRGGEFAGFVAWIESLVGWADWTVSGHSGAGMVISGMLAQNPLVASKIVAVDMLDAAYGMSLHLAEWKSIVKASPRLKITCVGNGTLSGCRTLQSSVPSTEVISTAVDHCHIPNEYFGLWLKSI